MRGGAGRQAQRLATLERRSKVREDAAMIFDQVRHGGCLSYLIGCEETCSAVLVDPELEGADRYLALAAEKGLRIRYLLDTHTHADHFTATRPATRSPRTPPEAQDELASRRPALRSDCR